MASPTDGRVSRLGDKNAFSILITVLNYVEYSGGEAFCQQGGCSELRRQGGATSRRLCSVKTEAEAIAPMAACKIKAIFANDCFSTLEIFRTAILR